jgi:hypothetical protein
MVAINHQFQSQKGDGADPTLLQPSHWNAGHNITMGGNAVVGNTAGSAGPVQEIPLTAFGAEVLGAANPNAAGVVHYPAGSDQLIDGSIPRSKMTDAANTVGLAFVCGDGSAAIQDGYKASFRLPFPCVITEWFTDLDTSASVTVSIYKNGAQIITANLSNAQSGQATVSIACNQFDFIQFFVSGGTAAKNLTTTLILKRTGTT